MRKLLNKDFVKFVIIGGTSTIINYGVFSLLLNIAHSNYLISSWIGYISWLIFGYFFNKLWTFQKSWKHHIGEIIPYIVVYTFWLLLNLTLLYVLTSLLWIDPFIGNVIAIAVTTMTNYSWLKRRVFKK